MKDGKQLVPMDLELTDEEEKAIKHVATDEGLSPDEWMRRNTAEFVREDRAAQ